MARNFLSIHCRKCRGHIPSRHHERRRQSCLLPRQRQRDVVPARKRHGAIAGDRPSDHEEHDRGSALSSSTLSADRPRSTAWNESFIEEADGLCSHHNSRLDHLMKFLKTLALSLALLTT